MLKYLTRLHLVGIGQAFPDSSNHFAHEQIVFQAPRRPSGGLADFSEIAVHTCLCLKLVGRRRCGAKTQGQDIAGLLDSLKIGEVDLVTHDIGDMVGYAFAAEHPDRVMKFVIMDAPLPSVAPWMTSSALTRYGIFHSTGRTPNGW